VQSLCLLKAIESERLQQNRRILWICDIHTLFVRFVLFSHHNHSLSSGNLRLSVCIVGVVLFRRLFQFHQNDGLQQLERKQSLDFCLACGLGTALVCSMAIWLWIMYFLMRMEWFKSQISVWADW
jgi:tRNA A22 N-methylase